MFLITLFSFVVCIFHSCQKYLCVSFLDIQTNTKIVLNCDENHLLIFIVGQKEEVKKISIKIVEQKNVFNIQSDRRNSVSSFSDYDGVTMYSAVEETRTDQFRTLQLLRVHEFTPVCAGLLQESASLIEKLNQKLKDYNTTVVVDGKYLYLQRENQRQDEDYDYVDVVRNEAFEENEIKQIILSCITEIFITLDFATANDDEFKCFLKHIERENNHLVGFQEQFGFEANVHIFGWAENVQICQRQIIEKESICKEMVSMVIKIESGFFEFVSRHYLSGLKGDDSLFLENIQVVFEGTFRKQQNIVLQKCLPEKMTRLR